MKKRPAILVIFLSLILINLVSAYYGSYNSFSLSNLLNEIDASTMILGSIFIVSFAILNFALGRAFRGNKAIAGIISFVISLMIIWGINQTGFDYEGIFYSIGISESLLGTLAPIILLLGSILIILKFGLGILLMILGLFLVGLAFFTDKIYENGIATVIAIVLILIGAILWRKKKYREEGLTGPGGIKRGLGATGRTTGKIGKWGARQVGKGAIGTYKTARNASERIEKMNRERGRQQRENRKRLKAIQDRIDDINNNLNGINRAIISEGNLLRTRISNNERAIIRQELIRLRNERRQLQNELTRLQRESQKLQRRR